MNRNKNTPWIVGIGLLVMFGILAIVISLQRPPQPSKDTGASTNNTTQTDSSDNVNTRSFDDKSGDTRINRFLEFGANQQQLDVLQFAFYKFAQQTNQDVKTMRIDEASVKHILPDSDVGETDHTYTFNVSFGKNAYSGRWISKDFKALQLQLFDTSGNQKVYDSGDLQMDAIAP